ncbi:MAG TPA: PQQ-binding-like beta-propeller repeat protein [Actinomycetota bacterium]
MPRRPPTRRAAAAAVLVVVLGLLLSPGAALAAGAPPASDAWPQFGQGATHLGTATGDTPHPPYRSEWRFPTPHGERALSAPVLTGDTAIALGTRFVYGLDLATGKPRWQIGRNGGSTLATPAVADVDGKQILLFTQGGTAKLSALVAYELPTGSDQPLPTFLWQLPLNDRSTTGVSVDGDTAFTADIGGDVTAVHISTEVQHVDVKRSLVLWDAVVGGVVPTPPAVGDGRVVVASRNRTTGAIEVDGIDESTHRIVWRKTDTAASSTSAITIDRDRVIVGFGETSGAGVLFALDLKDGLVEWSTRFSSPFLPFTNIPVAGGFAFALGNRLGLEAGLYRVRVDDGARVSVWSYGQGGLWSFEFDISGVFASPVVVGDSVVIGFDDGRIAAVDATSGVLVWRTDTGTAAVHGLAAGDDVIVASVGSRRGGVYAYQHDPGAPLLDEVSSSKPNWARMLGGYAVAFVGIGALAALAGFLLRPPGPGGPTNERADEPEEPDEDDVDSGEDDDDPGEGDPE